MKALHIVLVGLISLFQSATDNVDNYFFDYKLEYKVTYFKEPAKDYTITYYINSKDNSYWGSLKKINDTESDYLFIDQKGKSVRAIFQNSQIASHEKNGIAVTSFGSFRNPYKYQVDNYDFFKLTDTVIDEKIQSRYLLRSTNAKREKKKRLWRNIYMIDKSKSIKPLLPFATAYEIWKVRNNFPDGLITQQDHYNNKGILVFSEKITKVNSLNFSMKLNGN